MRGFLAGSQKQTRAGRGEGREQEPPATASCCAELVPPVSIRGSVPRYIARKKGVKKARIQIRIRSVDLHFV